MIHQYKLNGYNVVLDVYSGAIHVVDDVAYDIIRLFCEESKEEIVSKVMENLRSGVYGEPGRLGTGEDAEVVREEDILECYEDVKALKEAGKLFTEDNFRINAGILKEKNSDIKALCLHVSHACDLTCSYCFAGQGRFNGPSALMSLDVGKRAIDFLIENSGTRHNLEVDFFGGEPLLNFDVVKDIVKYARTREKETGKNFRFTLTTNGMGIDDEVIDFANRECHNVVLSLDGRREIHDRERKTQGGKGSYDIIVPKFQKLVEARAGTGEEGSHIALGRDTGNTNYYIRGTFTHYNPDFTEDIFHMTELGFDELSMEPVVTDPSSPFALREEDLPVLFKQYEILAEEMLKREREYKEKRKEDKGYKPPKGRQPFTFYHYMLDLEHGPCIHKRISGCGSGTEYFAVTPSGELYPCHQFVGDEKYLMGDIWKGIYKEPLKEGERSGEEIRGEFKKCNVYARPQCDDCWAKFYCSGGCAANSYHATGSILGTYDYGCKLFMKRMECAIMMEVARRDYEEKE